MHLVNSRTGVVAVDKDETGRAVEQQQSGADNGAGTEAVAATQ
jgi:hypothetical protein